MSKAKILEGPTLYLSSGSTLNLTCVVRDTPEPPDYIFWYYNGQVGCACLWTGRLTVGLVLGDQLRLATWHKGAHGTVDADHIETGHLEGFAQRFGQLQLHTVERGAGSHCGAHSQQRQPGSIDTARQAKCQVSGSSGHWPVGRDLYRLFMHRLLTRLSIAESSAAVMACPFRAIPTN